VFIAMNSAPASADENSGTFPTESSRPHAARAIIGNRRIGKVRESGIAHSVGGWAGTVTVPSARIVPEVERPDGVTFGAAIQGTACRLDHDAAARVAQQDGLIAGDKGRRAQRAGGDGAAFVDGDPGLEPDGSLGRQQQRAVVPGKRDIALGDDRPGPQRTGGYQRVGLGNGPGTA
jgi:hypothetical protein